MIFVILSGPRSAAHLRFLAGALCAAILAAGAQPAAAETAPAV
jgi:hypothetical protein